jgi:glycosyltransferase involved in cell wall biosynthesis
MPSITILTPGQVGSNPRVVKEATTLAEAGADVHVVATKVMAGVEPLDQAVLSEATWSHERIRLDNRFRWLRERLLQAAASSARQVIRSAWLGPVAHSAFTRQLTRAASARRADLYIAHYVAALPAAAKAAARHGTRFAFDAEDFHLGDLPDTPEHHRSKSLIREIEQRYLPHAAYVTAASPGIAAAYAAEYGIRPPTVLRNVFPKAEAPVAATAAGTVRPQPTVYWFSQTRGTERGLECALEAIAIAKTRPHLHIRGFPQAGFDEAFLARARALGCEDRVHLLDPVDPTQMVPLASCYDVGFVGETGKTQNRQIALTNKQFTYLLAGIPAVLSDIPAHREFATEAQDAAFLFRNGDPASLAEVLDKLLSDPARLEESRKAAYAMAQSRFNWDAESALLLELVETATGFAARHPGLSRPKRTAVHEDLAAPHER